MSEQILKAILRIFAVVARQDDVTRQERDQINMFLHDHLNETSVPFFADLFDKYVAASEYPNKDAESQSLRDICREINDEITRKQKIVIILELIRIVYADESLTSREEDLLEIVIDEFKVSREDLEAIKVFVSGDEAGIFDNPAMLIVSSQPEGSFSHAHHIHRHNLKGVIAVLYVQSADMYFIKYIGNADIYLNGVPVRSGYIGVFAVGSTIRWDRDDPVYFGDVLNLFKQLKGKSRITFEGRNITYRFKNGGVGLRRINLFEESGRLIALMGASGAGKSTLLNVLNGSEKPSQGQVLVNGIDIHGEPGKIEGIIGFVPQDDLLIEDLTVYQNLYYAARLCFADRSDESIDLLVLRVLDDLGLSEIKHLRVGSPLQKTISGGQRKRLNIGLELLREPAILFCDEPTSGLSSRDSENIIDLLKELSLKGKLVFTVIHQPSSDIFKKFDKLLILDTGGYQIYYGNPVDAIVYFKKCIDLLNSEQGECHACGNVNPEQIFNIIETRIINEYGHFTNQRKILPEQWEKFYLKTEQKVEVQPAQEPPHSTLRLPGNIKQARLFALRDLQAKLHNKQYLIINLLEAPLLAFILAFIVRYFNADDKAITGYVFGKNLNMPAYFFMSVIVALFMGLTVSAEEIFRDRRILKREAFLHLSWSSYLLSKISILFALSAVQTLTFVIVGNSLLEVEHMLPEHWLILFSTSCFANLLGLNISSAFNSAVTIYILIPLLLIPQLVLSGVVVKFDKLNPAIGNDATVPFVGDLMASRWAFEASMVTQFKDNIFEANFYDYDKQMAQANYKLVYFIPAIETRLQNSLNDYHDASSEDKARINHDLEVVRNETHHEMSLVGRPESDWVPKLTADRFDTAVYNKANAFYDVLKTYYSNKYNSADNAREQKIRSLTDTPQKEAAFDDFKNAYYNDAIAEQVKNTMESRRIIEQDDRLVQKINPIFKDPDPDSFIDIDAQFYTPLKYFMGVNIDTLLFNCGVVWFMTLTLAVALYFDLLRKLIEMLGNIGGVRRGTGEED